jgi:hypothetical protein
MKKLMFVAALLIAFTMQSCTEKEKVPEKVLSAFSQKFPEAKKVAWEMEDEIEWEAEFKMEDIEYSANFNMNGDWIETEYEIKESAIPSNIRSILDQNFTDYEIEKAEIAETTLGKSYEFEIEVGEEEFDVVIDSNGKLIVENASEEDEENEED